MEFSELRKRFGTSLILLLCLGAISFFDEFADIMCSILMLALYSEMLLACYSSSAENYKKMLVFALGFVYLFFGIGAMNEIIFAGGFELLLRIIASVVIIDMAGYFVGNFVKGPLFWPAISPKKTWSGIIGSCLFGLYAFEFLLMKYFIINGTILRMLFALSFTIITILGDFIVSVAKRTIRIKDSSNLLPGHGGLWDRCDSLLAGCMFMTFIKLLIVG